MNVVFIGSSTFGLRCLETCLHLSDVVVVGAITAPLKFTISYCPSGVTNVLHADISALAHASNIPIRKLKRSMNDEGLFEAVAAWKPDMYLVAGWYHMIPRRWRDLAPAYGLHASLLPDYSGGAPLVWAMINGEKKTGITLFQMDDNVDSGPIAGQKEEQILPTDTIATLYQRIEMRGIELIIENLPKIAVGDFKLRNQNQAVRRVMPQRTPEDGWIDWGQDSVAIDRFIRAQTRPYPGAFTLFKGKRLYIWKACLCECLSREEGVPGLVIMAKKGKCVVFCGEGCVSLEMISYEERDYVQNQIKELFSDRELFGM